MSAVNQLAYVAATTRDVSAWREYGTEVMGLELGSDSNDQLMYLRADERHHRLAVRAGDNDDVEYVGWEVANQAALEAAAAAVERQGVAVIAGKPEEAADRRVLDFVHFTCPHSGVRMELVVGHEQVFTPRFRATRDLAGFETGDMGMGHVVLYAPDVRAAADFYVKALGFGVTDYAIIPNVGPLAAFLHCNQRHHSLAFMTIPGAPRKIQHIMFETVSMDDVGLSYDVCLDRHITTTSPGRHHNDHTFSFYFRNPSDWHFEYGWAPRKIDPEKWDTEHYLLRPGNAWGHHGLMEMI
jgi:2,3-dihydroxybiphenyl 1,2-dioxygenase